MFAKEVGNKFNFYGVQLPWPALPLGDNPNWPPSGSTEASNVLPDSPGTSPGTPKGSQGGSLGILATGLVVHVRRSPPPSSPKGRSPPPRLCSGAYMITPGRPGHGRNKMYALVVICSPSGVCKGRLGTNSISVWPVICPPKHPPKAHEARHF